MKFFSSIVFILSTSAANAHANVEEFDTKNAYVENRILDHRLDSESMSMPGSKSGKARRNLLGMEELERELNHLDEFSYGGVSGKSGKTRRILEVDGLDRELNHLDGFSYADAGGKSGKGRRVLEIDELDRELNHLDGFSYGVVGGKSGKGRILEVDGLDRELKHLDEFSYANAGGKSGKGRRVLEIDELDRELNHLDGFSYAGIGGKSGKGRRILEVDGLDRELKHLDEFSYADFDGNSGKSYKLLGRAGKSQKGKQVRRFLDVEEFDRELGTASLSMSIPGVIASTKSYKNPISIQDAKYESKKGNANPAIIDLNEAGLKGKSQKSSETIVITEAEMKSSKSKKFLLDARSAIPEQPAEPNELTSYIEMRSFPAASTSAVNAIDRSEDASSAGVITSFIAVSAGFIVVAAFDAF